MWLICIYKYLHTNANKSAKANKRLDSHRRRVNLSPDDIITDLFHTTRSLETRRGQNHSDWLWNSLSSQRRSEVSVSCLSLSLVTARQRHLRLHLREDSGDGTALTDAQTDQPDQERAWEGGKSPRSRQQARNADTTRHDTRAPRDKSMSTVHS